MPLNPHKIQKKQIFFSQVGQVHSPGGKHKSRFKTFMEGGGGDNTRALTDGVKIKYSLHLILLGVPWQKQYKNLFGFYVYAYNFSIIDGNFMNIRWNSFYSLLVVPIAVHLTQNTSL